MRHPPLQRLPLRQTTIACALLLAALPTTHAQAQTANTAEATNATAAVESESAAAIDQVTIVGSRARNRTVFDSAVPIDRFGTREVENALSAGDLGAALQALAPSSTSPASNRAAQPTR